jgi:thiamine-monophosphate kinase
VSDGLLLDAARLARASGVCIDVDSTALPIPEAVQTTAAAYNLDPLTWVLGGGDDHALLATFAPGDVPEGFTAIGRVEDSADDDVRVDGQPVSPQGYEHFGG